MSCAWDPYTAKDCSQLEMVQRWAACFVKRDYRRTTSASSILMGLRWTQLQEAKLTSHAVQSNPQLSCYPANDLR